jgi:hypothetical protein
VEHKTARYGLWGAIMAAVITGAVALFIHFDEKSEKEKIEKLERKADQSKNTANLTISNVYLPPINTVMDSAFFVEISNNSLNIAKDLSIKINFGEATVSKCETLPINVFKDQKEFKSSIVSFSIDKIENKDKLYIYCFLSNPIFESILITGPNLFSNKELTYANYNPIKTEAASGFITFFKVIGTIIAVVFAGYFIIVIITFFNKLLGPNFFE